jgi:quercetin dioxygenase-like cupin family protein
MIRCIRLWTGDDDNSHFEEGVIDLPNGERGDILSSTVDVGSISFRETKAGAAFEWHDAPARQFVITLSGTLDFQTRTGEHFMLHPGDILLAEDTAGTGHSWKLVDEKPWRRAYVILSPGAEASFVANSPSSLPS